MTEMGSLVTVAGGLPLTAACSTSIHSSAGPHASRRRASRVLATMAAACILPKSATGTMPHKCSCGMMVKAFVVSTRCQLQLLQKCDA